MIEGGARGDRPGPGGPSGGGPTSGSGSPGPRDPSGGGRALGLAALAAGPALALVGVVSGSTRPGTAGLVVAALVAAALLAAAAVRERAALRGRPAATGAPAPPLVPAALGLLAAATATWSVAVGVAAASGDPARPVVAVAAAAAGAAGAAWVVAALLLLAARWPGRSVGRRRDAVVVAVAALAAVASGAGAAVPASGAVLEAVRAGGAVLPAPAATGTAAALLLAVAALGGRRTGPALRPLVAGTVLVTAASVAAGRSGAPPAALLLATLGAAATGASGPVRALPGHPPGWAARPGPARRSSDRGGDRRPVPAAVPRPVRVLPVVAVAAALALVAAGVAGAPVPAAGPALGLAALALAVLPALAPRGRAAGTGDGARTDPLTGLASRKAVTEVLGGAPMPPDGADPVPGAGWEGWTDRVALLLVDLDRFDDINAALGREAGDAVLTEVGARLRTVLRPEQLLARLGGDEFAVLLPGAGPEPATRVAQSLRDALAEPLDADGTRLFVRASVGVATCLLPRGEPGDLLRQADLAVTRAKAAGTGVEVYDAAVDRLGPGQMRRIDELRSALDRGELEVHLQPQVELATGRVVGAEALARWRHAHDGVLLPAAFLPLAAQTGLLRPVAAAVIDAALTACARWWAAGHRVPVSVNLTADDLRDPALTGLLLGRLARHGLPAAALRVELTEDVLVTDPLAVGHLLRRWRAAGLGVALDDYGTGYSSLAYLRELPLDELKLDRAFVADLRRPSTATIVLHTIAMAHGLGLRVVAEGIEDAATAAALGRAGCDVGQGLHFGAAMTATQFVDHLRLGD